MRLLQKISSGLAVGALLAAVFTPSAFASTSISVSNNSNGSTNSISVTTGNVTSSVTIKNSGGFNSVSFGGSCRK